VVPIIPRMGALVLGFATPDWIVIGAVALFAWWGAMRGFVSLALHTAGLYGGYFLAARVGPSVGAFLARTFDFVPAAQADLWGWVVVVVGCWIAVAIVVSVVRGGLVRARLRGADRFLGAAAGAVLAFGLCAFAFTVWASAKTRLEVKEAFHGSVAVRPMARVVSEVKPMFPEGIRARWNPVLESLSDGR
jgi:uncharacterized membrane protein required for colicin V production